MAAGARLDLLRVAFAKDDGQRAAVDLVQGADAEHVVVDLVAGVGALLLATSLHALLHRRGRIKVLVATLEDPREERRHRVRQT